MPSRKRGLEEMEADEPKQEPSLLQKIRNMWEFASLMQYIFFFGKAVKIDEELDIEKMEEECLKPTHSERLSATGLALLKNVSSHKGLTPEIFDEYTRRQYLAKAPQRNPFGVDEEPKKFAEFDTFTKIRVLHQLSTWTLHNPDRIREKLPEVEDQTDWRIEPVGWDAQDRTYFLLDDNRLYRRTDPPSPAPPKPKSKAKSKNSKGTRASKRRKLFSTTVESGAESEEEGVVENTETGDEGFGGMKWECLAVTLEDYHAFLDSVRRSRDPNEKDLHVRITEDVLPVIEAQAEEQRRKEARKLKELENMEKLATAKRSSRIADRVERQKAIDEAKKAEQKRLDDIAMAEREQKIHPEETREFRRMTREQRVKEREVQRIRHEQEMARLKEDQEKVATNEARMSKRKLNAEIRKRQAELNKLEQEEEDWEFDCAVCGVHGKNLDDGTHSIACEQCNVWQHSACHGIKQEDAERDDFHFICADCKRRANEPKIPPLKFRLGPSASPKGGDSEANNPHTGTASSQAPRRLDGVHINVQARAPMSPPPKTPNSVIMNGPSLSPHGQSPGPPPGIQGLGVSYPPPYLGPNGHPAPSPGRPSSSGFGIAAAVPNGTALSPLQYWQHQNGYTGGQSNSNYQSNGFQNQASVFTPQAPPYHPPHNPYMDPFQHQRPPSAHSFHGFQQSPVKHHHLASSPPPQMNGYASPSVFPPASSPNTSFPPPPPQPAQHPPIKQPPSPPETYQTPASYSLLGATPGYSPTKSPPRAGSARSVSGTPVVPPVTALSPSANRQQRMSMEPPAKKMTPEKPQANGLGSPL